MDDKIAFQTTNNINCKTLLVLSGRVLLLTGIYVYLFKLLAYTAYGVFYLFCLAGRGVLNFIATPQCPIAPVSNNTLYNNTTPKMIMLTPAMRFSHTTFVSVSL